VQILLALRSVAVGAIIWGTVGTGVAARPFKVFGSTLSVFIGGIHGSVRALDGCQERRLGC
jgi:hypothetical protein